MTRVLQMNAGCLDESCVDRVAKPGDGAAEDVETWPEVADTAGREGAHDSADLRGGFSGRR